MWAHWSILPTSTHTTDLADGSVVVAGVTSLLKFLLDSLQHCGSHYPIVFKALNEFCHGHLFLSTKDRSYLFEQLKKSKFDAEIAQLEGEVCVSILALAFHGYHI